MMTDTWTWATVTQATPLRIKVDGDTTALDATTDNLVGSLAVDDRVRVHLHADGIIVTGAQGGAGDGQLPERLRVLAKDISGLNLNDYMETGWYRGQNVINAPGTNWYYFEVIAHRTVGSQYSLQVATELFGNRRFYRRVQDSVWKDWVEIAAYDSDGRLKAADGVADDDVSTVGQLIPVGGGITWWGASDPASPGGGIEYAIPDGRALSRSTYSVLYTLWGTTFGTGNGTSTFNMPDAQGRVQVGRDSADTDFDTMGETRGAKTHTLTADESGIRDHAHDIPARNTSGIQGGGDGPMRGHGGEDSNFRTGSSLHASGTYNSATISNDALAAHNNIQPSIVANTAIRIK